MSDHIESSPAPALPEGISAVIFDWAGTILDFGCIAPVAAFREAFGEFGLEITEAETRLARAQGYSPDSCVTVSDVKHGRPWPDMLVANVLALNLPDVRACVADLVPVIEQLNARFLAGDRP